MDNVELVMRYALHTILYACVPQSDRHCHEHFDFVTAVAANVQRLKEIDPTSPFTCFNAALYCGMMGNARQAMQVTQLITLHRKI